MSSKSPPRFGLRFSTRTLLLGVTAIGIVLGVHIKRTRDQRQAVEAIGVIPSSSQTPSVYYDYELNAAEMVDPEAISPVPGWLLNALGDSNEEWVFTLGVAISGLVWIPFGALLLGYPTGRLETKLERVIPPAAGILITSTALLRLLFDPTPAPARCESCPESAILLTDAPAVADTARIVAAVGSVVLLVLVMGGLVRRLRVASPALRRLLWPVLTAAIATLVSLALFVVADQVSAAAADGLLLLFYVVFTTVPLAFLFGVLRTRLARSSVTDVVMALERGTPLRDALSNALGDPSVQVVYRIGAERGLSQSLWVDPRGWAVPEGLSP